jgi:outer membrane protein, multidrug efflux system
MKKATTWLFLASATITQATAAQPAPPAAPAPAAPARPAPAAAPRAPAAAPAPGTAAPGARSDADIEPNLPNVDDPMLVEPPPAPRELRSWQEALRLLRTQAPSLRTALARVDVAAARARQSLAAALPVLLGSGQAGFELIRGTRNGERVPENAFGATGQLDLRIPIFAPKAWYDHGTAKRAIEQTRLEVSEIERQIVAALADAIVNAVTGERLAEVTRVSLKSALSTLDLNKRRAALGASSTLDVLRAEQEVELARQQVITADESLLRTRESLGQALGSSEPWGVTTGIHLDTLAQDARKHCRQVAGVQDRPDIVAANSNVSLVERQKGSVNRAFWPTVDAASTLQVSPERLPQNYSHTSWQIGLVLNWTIYDGGLRYGQRDEAEANLRVAQEDLTQTRLDAELEVNRAFRAVKVADAALTVSTRARQISAETARLARIAYINGSGTSFDLVENARLLRDAELDLTIKEFAVLRARVAALLALASCEI